MRRREVLAGLAGVAGVATAGGQLWAPAPAEASGSAAPEPALRRVYLSSYTSAGGPGVGVVTADLHTGKLVLEATADAGADPSWITLAPGRRAMYANNELVPDGLVTALGIDQSGRPRLLNQQPTGQGPVHVEVHPGGRFLFASLYTSGQVVVHPLLPDGRVGQPVHVEQHPTDGADTPVVHQVTVDPSGGWVLACDLGVDSVFVYRMDLTTGRLSRHDRVRLAAGAGPRHLAFAPTGRYAYVANEQDSTVTACEWHPATGRLVPVQTLPTLFTTPPTRNYPGEVVVSADGRSVYVSNRGHNSIARFAVGDDGRLRLVDTPSCGGDWPRHITLDPTDRWLYVGNQLSNQVVWFPRNALTGTLGAPAGAFDFTAVSRILFT